MWDCGLHFRFLQKATEAMFEMGQASVAASLAWQSRLLDGVTSGQQPAGFPQAFAWAPSPAPAAVFSWPPPIAETAPWSMWLGLWGIEPSSFMGSPAGTSVWPPVATVQAVWNLPQPWSLYQGPLIAMMLSCGVPYSVAAPTARASTSAMDAADAARAQWHLVFGGNAQPDSQETRPRSRLSYH